MNVDLEIPGPASEGSLGNSWIPHKGNQLGGIHTGIELFSSNNSDDSFSSSVLINMGSGVRLATCNSTT